MGRLKTLYYFAETCGTCMDATATDLAYHRFLVLIAYNMAQITLSYGSIFTASTDRPGQPQRHRPQASAAELLMFECFYFSVLNFSFFGYGDITPAHIPGKSSCCWKSSPPSPP